VDASDGGAAVMIVSAELDEIYALSDRIAVMYEGRITGFRPPSVPVEELGKLMAGSTDDGTDHSAPGPSGPPGSPPSQRGAALSGLRSDERSEGATREDSASERPGGETGEKDV
jgi:ABC-type sugar transport system ATPase subunit